MRTMVTVHDPAAQVINEAHNRILRFNHERDFAGNQQQPMDGVLYHYTTADGVKGILEQNEIWATSAYYMNVPQRFFTAIACFTWLSKAGSNRRTLRATPLLAD